MHEQDRLFTRRNYKRIAARVNDSRAGACFGRGDCLGMKVRCGKDEKEGEEEQDPSEQSKVST